MKTIDNKPLVKRCQGPWFLTLVTGDPHYHSIAPCSYLPENLIPLENSENIDFNSFWNGETIKEVRRANLSDAKERDKVQKNHCHNCNYYNCEHELEYLTALCKDIYHMNDEDWTQEQKDNLELAKLEFENGELEIKSTPLLFSALQGIDCNLNCRMCFQRGWTKKDFEKKKGKISADAILKLKPYIKKALHMALVGGEPLLMKESVELIKALVTDPDFKTVRISIWTNGMLS